MYALQELVDLVRKSDARAVDQVASYLCTSRLVHKSPVVKLKALKAIKYVAAKPECSAFRSAVQQHAGVLREHSNFSCSADPMKGNRPAELVRQAAKEAIHAIYSTDSSYGNDGSRGQAMQGFGSGGASTSNGEESASMRAASMFTRKGSDGGSGGFGVRLSWSRSSNGQNAGPQFAGSPVHSPRGGPNGSDAAISSAGADQASQGVPVPITATLPRNEPSSSESSIHRMEQILDKICTRKGMKLQPPADEVKKYVSAAQDVHIEDLWLTLKLKLSHEPWQQQYIGLCLLQALLGCHNKTFGSAVRAQAASDSTCVHNLCSAQNATLSNKARGILAKLSKGQSSPAQPQAPPPIHQQQQQHQQPDLLDLGLGSAPVGQSQPQAAVPGAGDLLQGLEVAPSTSAAATASAAAANIFEGLSVSDGGGHPAAPAPTQVAAPPSVPPPAASGQVEGGLFAGLDVTQKPPAAAAAPAQQQPPPVVGLNPTPRPPMSPPPMSPPPQVANAGVPMPPMMAPGMVGMPGGYGPGPVPNPMQMQQMMMQHQQQMQMQQMMMHQQIMMQQQQPMGMGGMMGGGVMGGMGFGEAAAPLPQRSPGPLSPARNSTMIDGRARPEPAFDFVQDHMQNLKGK